MRGIASHLSAEKHGAKVGHPAKVFELRFLVAIIVMREGGNKWNDWTVLPSSRA